jgi:hypothetical protein
VFLKWISKEVGEAGREMEASLFWVINWVIYWRLILPLGNCVAPSSCCPNNVNYDFNCRYLGGPCNDEELCDDSDAVPFEYQNLKATSKNIFFFFLFIFYLFSSS